MTVIHHVFGDVVENNTKHYTFFYDCELMRRPLSRQP